MLSDVISSKKREVSVTYRAHPAQSEAHNTRARFKVLACGRRWGKSVWGIMETWNRMRKSPHQSPRSWVIAPTFDLVYEDWRITKELLGELIMDQNVASHRMELLLAATQDDRRLGTMEFKSADRQDISLRGAGLDFALLDEAARIPPDAWELGIRPALSDRQGGAAFISTPFGRNWFYDFYKMGVRQEGGFRSWKFPSNSNPRFPKEEWDFILSTSPEQTIQQEYLAEFLEDASTPFHGLDSVGEREPVSFQGPERWVIGADLARTQDFSVFYPMNEYGEPGEIIRSREVSWTSQKKILQILSGRYGNARIILDSSGVGDPIEDDLHRIGVPTEGVKTGVSRMKEELIEGLQVAIEHRWLSLPPKRLHAWLWEELESFQQERTEYGHIRYHAPQGKHDDGVISLSLAVHGIGARLGRAQRTETSNKEEPAYTTWGDYWKIANRRRKGPSPFVPVMRRNLQRAVRFQIL